MIKLKRMKKVSLTAVFLVLILCTTFSFCSCKLNGKKPSYDNSPSNGDAQIADGFIFSEGTKVNIVYDPTMAEINPEIKNDLSLGLYYATDVIPDIRDASSEKTNNEIILGRTDRALSKKAYSYLEDKMMNESVETLGYVIYSNGNSVAIAYSDDRYMAAATEAVSVFLEKYVDGKNSLALKPGAAYFDTFSLYEYLQVNDDKLLDGIWLKLESEVGSELVSELKPLHKLLGNDGIVSWIANLYDPEIGGFYYSNSGRNTEGFLPDVDSTYQAITFILNNSGMAKDYGYGNGDIPDWMKQQMVRFAKGLQDPETGFFYHPQWSRELVDANENRRGRDLDRAVYLLRMFGSSPTYDTPNGYKGDGILADGTPVPVSTSALTTTIRIPTVAAVSKVVPVSSAYVPEHMRTKAAFQNYLATFELYNNSYRVGNHIGNQISQIQARENQLRAESANWSIAEELISWYNRHQNPNNGMWDDKSDRDAVNGLFKINGQYTVLGYEFPNAVKAAQAATVSITSDEEAEHVVELYNAWSCVGSIVDNVRQFGSEESASLIIEAIRSVAVESVEKTFKVYEEFQKSDGAFSYYKDHSSGESQGVPVGLGLDEADVNATTLVSSGVWSAIFRALDLYENYPPLFTSSDMQRFNDIISELGGIIKDERKPGDIITFDDEVLYGPSFDVETNIYNLESYSSVIKDPRNGKNGNILELRSVPKSGDNIRVKCESTALCDCFVFSGELCVSDANDGYVAQINLGTSAYMINIIAATVTDESGAPYQRLSFVESSSAGSPRIDRDLGVHAKVGEWFKIKIEYYLGNHETVRIKVYFNNDIVAVSDNYYDGTGNKVETGHGTPSKYYSNTTINVISDQDATLYFDNLYADRLDKTYDPEWDFDDQPLINCDPPTRGEVIYTFDELEIGKNFPPVFSVKENSGSVDITDAGGKKLTLTEMGGNNPAVIVVPSVFREKGANCATVQMDVTFNSGDVGSSMTVRLRENNRITGTTGAITAFNLTVIEIDGKKHLAVAEAPNGINIRIFDAAPIALGESAKLRVEHYEKENQSFIYLNGVLIGVSDSLATGGGNLVYGKLEITATSGSKISVSIDNLIAETSTKDFADAAEPEFSEVIHDFSDGLKSGVELSGAEIAEFNNEKMLAISGGGEALIPINYRSKLTSFVGFKMELSFDDADAEGCCDLLFVSDDKKALIAYELIYLNGKIYIYELTEQGVSKYPVTSIGYYDGISLEFEYFPAKNVINIYSGTECIAVSSIIYAKDGITDDFYGVKIMVDDLSDRIYVDNCISESYIKIYKNETPNVENTEDESHVITFESSSTGNLPNKVNYELYSLGAAIRIEDVIRNGIMNRVLAQDTSSDASGDALNLSVTELEQGFNAVVFESDVCLSAKELNRISYQIYFENAESGETLYLTSIEHAGSALRMIDYSSAAGESKVIVDGQNAKLYRNNGNVISTGIGADTWFNLRIECYDGTRNEMRIKTYINNTLVYVTNNFGDSHKLDEPIEIEKVDRVRVMALSNCEATARFDNMSLKCINKELSPDPQDSSIIKLFPTTNTPVIIKPAPSVDPDEVITERLDFENGKVTSNFKTTGKDGDYMPELFIKDGRLVFASDGGHYIKISPTVKQSGHTYSVFEADFAFNFLSAEGKGNTPYYTFTMCNDIGATLYRFNAYYDGNTGNFSIYAYTSTGVSGDVISIAIGDPENMTATTTTLNLKVESYFVNGETFVLTYFNDKLVYATGTDVQQNYVTVDNAPVSPNMLWSENAKTYGSFSRLDINSHLGKDTIMHIDNLRFFQGNVDFDDSLVMPKPGAIIIGQAGEGVYNNSSNKPIDYTVSTVWSELDLNNTSHGDGVIWRSTGSTGDGRYVYSDNTMTGAGEHAYLGIRAHGDNKVLEFGQPTAYDRKASVFFKNNSPVGNMYVFETDIAIGSFSGLEIGDVAVEIKLNSDKTINSYFFSSMAIVLVENGRYALSNGEDILASFDSSTWQTLTLEYYSGMGMAVYYLNGELVGCERFIPETDDSNYAFASLSLGLDAYESFIFLDNTVVTSIEKKYEGYVDPQGCQHKDADGDMSCDYCNAEYHDPQTCVHSDAEGNGICDKCGTGYYDPETCTHADLDGGGFCDKCGIEFHDQNTCKHKDNNNNQICDKCGAIYIKPEDSDDEGTLGGNVGEDLQGWT